VFVIIFGYSYPQLGYTVAAVFLGGFIFGVWRGRWMCGNLCPRGSFSDQILSKFSLHKRIPVFLRTMGVRIHVLILMMGFMIYRLIQSDLLIVQIGLIFLTTCILTSIIAIVLGVVYSPRAWCVFCPMGTIQRFIGKGKHQLHLDPALCIDCGKCEQACPMQFKIYDKTNPDCIKCERCMIVCPKNAISLKA